MKQLPKEVEAYRTTALFNRETVPAGLKTWHDTKAGVWGRIEVVAGTLHLTRAATPETPETIEIISAGNFAIIAPRERHLVALKDDTQFQITFLRVPKKVGE